jgi:acetyl esterase/lipase
LSAGQDLLVDENAVFAEKLLQAGNRDVERVVYQAMPHAFYYFLGLCTEEDDAYQAMAAFLRRSLQVEGMQSQPAVIHDSSAAGGQH